MGQVKTLTARDTMYTYFEVYSNLDMPARMLLNLSDNAIAEVDVDASALID